MSDQPSFLLMVPVYTLSIFPFSPSYPSNTNIYSVIIICRQNTKKYKMTNTENKKKNTSILFPSNSFASSLVPVWQPTDRPTDKRKVFFIGSCAQPVVRISLEFEIQNTRNTKYKKLKFEIQYKRPIFIWENGIFFFAQLCLVVAGTWFR